MDVLHRLADRRHEGPMKGATIGPSKPRILNGASTWAISEPGITIAGPNRPIPSLASPRHLPGLEKPPGGLRLLGHGSSLSPAGAGSRGGDLVSPRLPASTPQRNKDFCRFPPVDLNFTVPPRRHGGVFRRSKSTTFNIAGAALGPPLNRDTGIIIAIAAGVEGQVPWPGIEIRDYRRAQAIPTAS